MSYELACTEFSEALEIFMAKMSSCDQYLQV